MNLWKHVSKNLFVALFLGSIPSVLMLEFYGFEELTNFLKGIIPVQALIVYSGLLFGLHVFLSLVILYLKRKGISIPGTLMFLAEVFAEIGYTLQGIYLALAGAIIITVIPIPLLERTFESLILSSAAYYIAVGCLFVGCFMSAIKEKISDI